MAEMQEIEVDGMIYEFPASMQDDQIKTVLMQELGRDATPVDMTTIVADKGVDVEALIREAGEAHGVDPVTLLAIAQVESGLKPDAQNPKSSAGGLFQFIDKTWEEFGAGGQKLDPVANADAGARFIKRNASTLRGKLGREPSVEEVYMAHFFGSSGALEILEKLRENPDMPATEAVSSSVRKANPSIFKEGITITEALDKLTSKVRDAASKYNA